MHSSHSYQPRELYIHHTVINPFCAYRTFRHLLPDPEILERRYPVVLRRFSLRQGSGGAGQWWGGDGVIREVRVSFGVWTACRPCMELADEGMHVELNLMRSCCIAFVGRRSNS
jgi:hypothetical protein